MARNVGPVCRLCRREGLKLFLKGERCYSDKCAIERRNYPPGAHGQARTRFSEFAIRLREKQKVKRIYRLLEKQFAGYFEIAERQPVTGEALLVLLERLGQKPPVIFSRFLFVEIDCFGFDQITPIILHSSSSLDGMDFRGS